MNEPKSIVGVKYKNKEAEGFGGRTYNYLCAIQVKEGDLVEAPTSYGISPAMVCEVDVAESQIDERIMPLLKTITKFAETQEVEQ